LAQGEAAAIRVEGLTKRYPSGNTVLTVFEDLSFDLHRGEQLAIVGESGSGKSTLLHLMGALDHPSSGRVFYGGKDLFSMQPAELAAFRNEHIGFVWQQQSLLPEFTAVENVMMPLLIRGAVPGEAAGKAAKRLDEVGLAGRGHHRSGELSGGEQQRVALARALVTEPAVLLADEPTGSLDHRTAEAIMGLLREMHRVHKLTSVIVTHNLGFAGRCDRILQLDKGAESARGPGGAGVL
jgi:lipoprotein-releasing system ATP-binding protein